jgi:hypothetical protein
MKKRRTDLVFNVVGVGIVMGWLWFCASLVY